MREGEASATAQRVAALRLTFERVAAPYGDPAADERLARDVAAGVPAGSSPLVHYLEARTTFFDRVVVGALDRGVAQVVVAGAGYDGRALRYAKPGARWFEVDHPATQHDKRSRLDRLAIDAPHVTFVVADFTRDRVDDALAAAGHDRHEPSLFLLEGVAVYLEPEVVESVLAGLRAAAATGSTLAISVSTETGSKGGSARREAFRAGVASLGEPVRSSLGADELDALFTRTGWDVRPGSSERARVAGLVVAVTAAGRGA